MWIGRMSPWKDSDPHAAGEQKVPKHTSQNKQDPPQVAPRSRSTQVSDEFVRRHQAADPPQVAPPDDLCKDQMARLDTVVGLLLH